jgi:hypothetical protein
MSIRTNGHPISREELFNYFRHDSIFNDHNINFDKSSGEHKFNLSIKVFQ